jgi:hypothetical protein
MVELTPVFNGDSSTVFTSRFRFVPFYVLIFLLIRITLTAIPTVPNGGNHTREFRDATGTEAAHDACLSVSKTLAGTGIRVLLDDQFFQEVRSV